MIFKRVKDELPDGATIHHEEKFDAITVPAVYEGKNKLVGFHKLIAFARNGREWVHNNYRKKTKKRRKRT